MRIRVQMRSLAACVAALLLSSVADAEEPADSEGAEPEKTVEVVVQPEPDSGPDENPRAGYIPGYKRGPNLSLSPLAPRTGAMAGANTVPFFAPAEDEDWDFKFTGFASSSLRFSTGSRDDPTDDQAGTTLHAPPRIVDFYGAFQGTNVTPGGWVDLHFQYGTEIVQAHATLTTWKPGRGADYLDIRSQQLIDSAYLTFAYPITQDLRIDWTVGAFRNLYGGLGQYGAGAYNQFIIGMPYGVGETLALKYELGGGYALQLEHGIMGREGKPPTGSGPTPFDTAQTAIEPTSFVHHAHVGVSSQGDLPWVASLHYLRNWSQDETDQLDNPQTYWIDEGIRPDGYMEVLGADFRMMGSHLGNFAVAAAYLDARDAWLLNGFGFFGAASGEEVTKRYLGQQGGGTGKLLVGGVEYSFSWAKYLYYPEAFWGEGPDLITSVFASGGTVKSDDPDADGRNMFKAGAEVTYRFFPWAGISGRYDHVLPNSKDGKESFGVFSPKLLLRSQFLTHEQVTVSYTRWFYGSHTHAEFPYEMPRSELDEQMFALHFGMWW